MASTASSGSGTSAIDDAAALPDPRELSLVTLRMADEKVAPEVLESRGVLAASFDKSASHLLQGVAVIVEGVGYVLPFAIVLAFIFVPVFLAVRWRRMRRYEAIVE